MKKAFAFVGLALAAALLVPASTQTANTTVAPSSATLAMNRDIPIMPPVTAYIVRNPGPGEGELAYIVRNPRPGDEQLAYIVRNPRPGHDNFAYIVRNPGPGDDQLAYIVRNPRPGDGHLA